MELDEILNGDQVTGRQAAIIFFGWLTLVLVAGITLLLITSGTIG
jgi:predicted nucleic acid-binding Zn ribbon protein